MATIAAHAPRLAYRFSDFIAALSRPRHLRDGAISRVFPELATAEVTRKSWASHLRNATLKELALRSGLRAIRRHIRPNPTLAALRPPLILGTFHLGPVYALGTMLEQLPGEVLVLRIAADPWRVPVNATIAATDGNPENRAAVFHKALAALRANMFVLLALEGDRSETLEIRFGTRSAVLGRGAFALARITRVPILPIVANWHGTSLDVVCGDPISPSDDETAMAIAAGEWLERYLLAHPEEIEQDVLEVFK